MRDPVEAESDEQLRRPPIIGVLRGLAHHDEAIGRQQRHRTPDRLCRRPEATGDDGIGWCCEHQVRRIGGQDLDPAGEIEAVDQPSQVVDPRRSTIDQDQLEVGPGPSDHQARHATAAAEVDDNTRDAAKRIDERHGMLHDLGDRTLPEHSQALRRLEGIDQGLVVHRGRSAWSDDHASVRVLTLGPTRHPVDGGQCVVDDLAIG